MTDARLTNTFLEQWAVNNPQAQLTQVALEQWVVPVPPSAIMTQVVLEQWASVAGAGFFSARHV